MTTETFYDSEGVPFVLVDSDRSRKVFRMEGSKRIPIEAKYGAEIVLNSDIISRERALELAGKD